MKLDTLCVCVSQSCLNKNAMDSFWTRKHTALIFYPDLQLQFCKFTLKTCGIKNEV
jgi:hypothetical protein